MTLHLVGTWVSTRRLIKIDGKSIYLRPKSFRYIFLLAAAKTKPGGWIKLDDFEPTNVSRNMYRLRLQLKQAGFKDLIECNGGAYRLSDSITDICIERTPELENDRDCEIRGYFL